MKKYLLSLCLFAIIGCDHRFVNPFGGTSSQKSQPPELNEQFLLPIGITATFETEGLSIRFESVSADCRCPAGALCFWEGYAEIILTATDSEQHVATISLSTLHTDKRTGSFFSYTVELVELAPYPIVDRQTDTTAYQASLIVRKANVQ